MLTLITSLADELLHIETERNVIVLTGKKRALTISVSIVELLYTDVTYTI